MYFQLLKKYLDDDDMLSLENIISDIEPNVSNKQGIPTVVTILYEIICNTIIKSK